MLLIWWISAVEIARYRSPVVDICVDNFVDEVNKFCFRTQKP